ncbi:MAG: hypothetical protein OEW08_14915 [Gammaproteobacteria bacterium]|nr:hypothetical protein [Gammaproteobacteria bacterium]
MKNVRLTCNHGLLALLYVFLAASAVPLCVSANDVAFFPLNFRDTGSGQSHARVGQHVFILANPDNVKNPQDWDSTLTIMDAIENTECQTEPMLIKAIYTTSKGNFVLVVHYSGASTFIDLFDGGSCHELVPRIESATDRFEVNSNRMTLWPGCDFIDETLSTCTSAKIFDFNADFRPVANPQASKLLTRQYVGVEFVGIKKVYYAKTKRAQLAP